MPPRQAPPSPLLSLLLLTLTSTISSTTALSPSNSTSPPFTSPSNTTSTPFPSATPSTPALQIGDSSGTIYTYAGCWNESAGLPGTTGLRALEGASEVLPGEMTVATCLAFCARGSGSISGSGSGGVPQTQNHRTAYRLAGLEYSRECWCGDELNPLVVQLEDAACDLPCDGANTTACGGALKLSLYNATAAVLAAESRRSEAEGRWRGAWGGVVVGAMGLGLGFALGGL
ncbi:WSC domain-containing protein [Xylaria cf. heliscus]|nr:WSC domain-containing protein [Xylaria cf. heliscus]